MPCVPKTDEWKEWIFPKEIKGSYCLPIYNAVGGEWIVHKPDGSDDYMIVPDSEYRPEFQSRTKIKTRYD